MWGTDLDELWIFERYHDVRLEKLPQMSKNQLSMIFGGGVKKVISIFS